MIEVAGGILLAGLALVFAGAIFRAFLVAGLVLWGLAAGLFAWWLAGPDLILIAALFGGVFLAGHLAGRWLERRDEMKRDRRWRSLM
jgi:hypothetical protein